MKVFHSSILIFLISFFAGFASAVEAEDAGLKSLESQLSAEKKKLEASFGRERDLIALVESIDSEVKMRREEISRLNEMIGVMNKEHEAASAELEAVEKAMAARRRAVGERLVALYKHARAGYTRLLFGAGEMDAFWRAVKYASFIMDEDSRILDAHGVALREYERNRSVLRNDLTEKNRQIKSNHRVLAEMEARLEETIFKLINVHKEKEFYETAVRELQRASGEFGNTITEIEKRTRGETAFEGSKDPPTGTLPFPAVGGVIVSTVGEAGESRSGVFIEVPPGAEVKAVLPGRVEFSGPVKDHGQTVIINHGGRLYSVSSHLGRPSVGQGTSVGAGERIGTAGDRGGKGVVYFEIRDGGRPVDTRQWLRGN